MKQIAEQKKLAYCYIAAFLIPALLMLAVYILLGTYPFGDRSILVADLRYQFVDYYDYLKSIVFGDNDFFYTFSKSLGGDAIGFCAYYLQDPFNLLLLFFSKEMMPVGILIRVVLEAGFAGLIFNILINNMFKYDKSSLIFSTAYAFIGMYASYMNCIHYFFNIALFPLVILGVHRIVKEPKRKLLLILSLALSIITCYYMGYMAALFSAIFFIYDLLVEMKTIKRLKEYKDHIISFIIAGILSVGLSAFDLIPTVFSLLGEKSDSTVTTFILSRKFNLWDLFSNSYTMSFNGNLSDGLPVIYAGLTAVLFTLIYFTHKKVTLREKVLSLFLIGIMVGSFLIYAINLVWHGLSEPIGFPYRDSFIFSFLMLYFGYRGWILAKEEGIKIGNYLFILVVFLLYSAYLLFTKRTAVDMKVFLVNLVLLILIMAVSYGYLHQKRWTHVFFILFLILQCTDVAINEYDAILEYPDCKHSEYLADLKYAEAGISAIQDQDSTFYRMEKNFRRTHNDAMAHNFNGLSHFSSTQKNVTMKFLGQMGFRNNKNWAFYNDGSTTFADCFLGVKYLLSQFDAHGKPYPIIMSGDRYWVFENPYVLPLGFGITQDIQNVDMKQKDVFEIQNEIADSFLSKENHIYEKIDVQEIKTENLTLDGSTYTKIDPDQDAYIEYELAIDRKELVYLYFTAPEQQQADLIINGQDNRGQYFSTYNWDVMDLGGYEPGHILPVRLLLTGDTLTVDQAFFYYENQTALINWYEQSKINGWSPEKISSSHLKGEVTISNEYPYLMFSIPYEKDWKVYIDDQETNTIEVLDALMAVQIEPGEHVVEIKYIPRGLYFGVIISLISTFCIVVLIVSKSLKNQQKTR